MSRHQLAADAPPSVPDLGPPPRGKPPEVRAAEIIAAPLDRIAAALERLADVMQANGRVS